MKGFVLLAPILIGVVYVEMELRSVPNLYKAKRLNMERQLNDIEVLVFGSSQAFYGINPSYISAKAFNLAANSQSLDLEKEILLKYIDRMPKLKCVVFTISYHSLGYRLDTGFESWRKYFYYHFWDIGDKGLTKWSPGYLSYIYLYGQRKVLEFAIKGFKIKKVDNLSLSGHYSMKVDRDKQVNINDVTGKRRVALHDAMIRSANYSYNYRALATMVSSLRRGGVKVLIVGMPVYETYGKFVDDAIVERTKTLIDDLCERHGCSMRDYQLENDFRKVEFDDNDHLNEMGSERFSKIINEEVMAILN